MLERLNRLFGRPVTDATVDHKTGTETHITPNSGTRILIVDDSKTMHVVIGKALRQQGYECFSAYDGQSGLDLARECRPALIIMDVVMPGLNGFQAVRLLRRDNDHGLARTPVIVMSGNTQATEQFWSMKIGANDFMMKPFTNDELFARIEKCLFPAATDDVAVSTQASQPTVVTP